MRLVRDAGRRYPAGILRGREVPDNACEESRIGRVPNSYPISLPVFYYFTPGIEIDAHRLDNMERDIGRSNPILRDSEKALVRRELTSDNVKSKFARPIQS